jgi:hypothetical protein
MFMHWLPVTLLKSMQMKELAYKLLHPPAPPYIVKRSVPAVSRRYRQK